MTLKLLIFISVYVTLFNMAHSQAYNRIIPNNRPSLLPINEAFPNIVGLPSNYPCDLPYEIYPNILPGQLQPNFVPLPNVMQPLPSVQPLSVLRGGSNVLPAVAPTIIQDGSVANNLANALQLLVVSNLLGNKLPLGERVVGYPPAEVISPSRYNYVL